LLIILLFLDVSQVVWHLIDGDAIEFFQLLKEHTVICGNEVDRYSLSSKPSTTSDSM